MPQRHLEDVMIERLAKECGAHSNTDFEYKRFALLVAEEVAKERTMPQRQLSPADWDLVVRYLNDVQHWLRVVNGSIQRDRLDTAGEIADLESALKLLGHNEGDPMPAQVRDQLAKPRA